MRSGELCWSTVAIGAATAALAVLGLVSLLASHQLGAAVLHGATASAGLTVMTVTALACLAERLRPARPRATGTRGSTVNLAYTVGYALLIAPLVVLADTGFLHILPAWAVLPRLWRVPSWASWLAGFAALDLCNWLTHLVNHRRLALWRLHALHHSDEELGALSAFRTHPLVHLSFVLSTLPLVCLSGDLTAGTTAVTISMCVVVVSHANVDTCLGPLGRLVVSPGYHRLHHELGTTRATNLGFVLTIWDVLARRADFPAPGRLPATGLAGRPVPVEQGDPSVPSSLVILRQLAEPFARAEVGAPVSAAPHLISRSTATPSPPPRCRPRTR